MIDAPSPETPSGRSRDVRGAVIFVGVLAALFFAPVPVCPTRILFRIPCPGCGLTRATMSLARGDSAASLHMHPLAVPALLVLSLVLVHTTLAVAERDASRPLPPWLLRISQGMLVLLFALWIARFFGAFGGPVPI